MTMSAARTHPCGAAEAGEDCEALRRWACGSSSAAVAPDPGTPPWRLPAAGTIIASAAFLMAFKPTWSSSMSRARIFALSCVAALALSSGALAQGGGAGGGGAGGGAGGAGGASGTTGSSSGRSSGPTGNSVAQPSSGQSSPTGNSAAQPPGSTGQNSINSPGTGVGPGSTGTNR